MIRTIYIEEEIASHPRVQQITQRFPDATQVMCNRYSSVFNSNAQNFRLQKQQASLILAKKHNGYVLPTPSGYGIGSKDNYYFSHMLNCVYDCRYCFLQGMYRSANYVVFVNYDDFFDEIESKAKSLATPAWFFSGYDCDSLAMEPVTGFIESALDRFTDLPNANMEIRTKSTQIRALLNSRPINNCVVAFSFSPNRIAGTLEHKVPSVEKRIAAASKLQKLGWKIGLRFDPVVSTRTIEEDYRELFDSLFNSLDADAIHSVSYGMFRLPKPFFKKMIKLYPEEKLFSLPLTEQNTQVSFDSDTEERCLQVVHQEITKYINEEKIFPCS